MSNFILHKDGAYQLYSTIMGAPCYPRALTLDDLRAVMFRDYGTTVTVALPLRLERAHATGCSAYGMTLEECISDNRAGPGETCVPFDEFVQKWLTLPVADEPARPVGSILKEHLNNRTKALIEQCRDALAEELAAWDIDPPLHHVKAAHDACERWLAANQLETTKPIRPCAWLAPETGQVYRRDDITNPDAWAVPLYDQATLDAAVAAERERWTGNEYHCTVKCARCGHKNYFTRAELERDPTA